MVFVIVSIVIKTEDKKQICLKHWTIFFYIETKYCSHDFNQQSINM
jgi:hypothetical protein